MPARARTGTLTRGSGFSAVTTSGTGKAAARRGGLALPVAVLAVFFLAATAACTRTQAAEPGLVKSGTAFFISPAGYLVTSAHVVAGCPEISVWPQGAERRAARLLSTDTQSDIALLQADGPVSHYMSQPHPGYSFVGQQVIALGYGVEVHDPTGHVARDGTYVRDDRTNTGALVRIVQFRSEVLAGESGGPAVGADGALFGMTIGRYTDRPREGVVLPVLTIEAFLSENGLGLQQAPSDDGARLDDRLAEVSALVQCLPGDASDKRKRGGN